MRLGWARPTRERRSRCPAPPRPAPAPPLSDSQRGGGGSEGETPLWDPKAVFRRRRWSGQGPPPPPCTLRPRGPLRPCGKRSNLPPGPLAPTGPQPSRAPRPPSCRASGRPVRLRRAGAAPRPPHAATRSTGAPLRGTTRIQGCWRCIIVVAAPGRRLGLRTQRLAGAPLLSASAGGGSQPKSRSARGDRQKASAGTRSQRP